MGRKVRKKRDEAKGKKPSRNMNSADRRFHQKTRLLVEAAQVAWDRGIFNRSIELFTQALRRDPKNPTLIVDLGRAHGLRRQFEDAETILDRAVRLAPKKADVHCMLARTYFKFGWFEKAAACYEQSLERSPSAEEEQKTHLQLARIYERLHRLDDARAAVERAMALQPDAAETRYWAAFLDRRCGDFTSAETALRKLLATPIESDQVEGDAWYELARILDHHGDFDQAMEAFLHAKSARRRNITEEWDQARHVADRNEKMLAGITPEHFQRWHDAGSNQTPLRMAVVTSHARSGTTLLEQVLDSHPDVISADEHPVMSEEVFTALGRRTSSGKATPIHEMLDRATPSDLASVRDTYWEHSGAVVGEPIGERMLLDKNPELTLLLPVINRVFPEMKVIFPLRDPRDVCLSCFMQPLPVNSVSVNFLTLEQTALKYALTMNTWLKLRPWTRADWIEVRYEDTVTDLESQARRLLEFLDLPWDERVLEFYKHAREKHVRSPTYEAVTQPVHTKAIGRWKNYEKYMEPLMETLRPFLREFEYS